MTTATLSGVAIRPTGSDDRWPVEGTAVGWSVAWPVQDMLDQGRKLGWVNLGTIGNRAHLQRNGDHTPWSTGKRRGLVYAKDTADPPWLGDALVKACRSNYVTGWIDFFNVNGRQYTSSGRLLGPSDDEHLHVSVRAGAELTRHTLFTDLAAMHAGTYYQQGDDMTPDQDARLRRVESLLDRGQRGMNETTDGIANAWLVRELEGLHRKVDALAAKVGGSA